MMREFFIEVIMHKDITPEALKRVTIKSGEAEREQKVTVHYVRCLYCTKCFRHFYTTCFYNKVDRRQPSDQRGGSSLTSNLHHLATCRLLEQQKPRVWCQDVDREGRLSKGAQHDTARRTVECPCKIRSRNAVL